MNTLQKSALAITLAAAAIGAGAQQAAPKADPKDMTADEKATLTLLQNYRTCVNGIAASNKEKAAGLTIQAKALADARDQATRAAMTDAATKAGLSAEQAKELVDGLRESDEEVLTSALVEAAKLPNPQQSCMSSLKIDPQADGAKVRALAEKYGPQILQPK